MDRKIRNMVGIGIFTAIVVVLQMLVRIPVGPFVLCPSLIPIVIGTAVYGWKNGAWLGLACGIAVLLCGDAALFLAISVPFTIITVLLKGVLCGLSSGWVYHVMHKWNKDIAAVVAAIVCPVVNTGVFLLGCLTFFIDDISKWAAAEGYPSAINYLIFFMVGGNFLIELGASVLFAPVITRLIRIARR